MIHPTHLRELADTHADHVHTASQLRQAAEEIEMLRIEAEIARAARDFYKSRVWFDLYRSGALPRQWPEYEALRNAILGRKR